MYGCRDIKSVVVVHSLSASGYIGVKYGLNIVPGIRSLPTKRGQQFNPIHTNMSFHQWRILTQKGATVYAETRGDREL